MIQGKERDVRKRTNYRQEGRRAGSGNVPYFLGRHWADDFSPVQNQFPTMPLEANSLSTRSKYLSWCWCLTGSNLWDNMPPLAFGVICLPRKTNQSLVGISSHTRNDGVMGSHGIIHRVLNHYKQTKQCVVKFQTHLPAHTSLIFWLGF